MQSCLVKFDSVYYLGAGADDVNSFLNEALIMKDFDHPNVLTLIGITMDKGEFPMVILPFMHNGALLTYIRDENNVTHKYFMNPIWNTMSFN